jgi:2-polyprenyl-3-methyl-5-hydroxy-6-metoxy-1,4-benzoquinol methylase
MTVTDTPGPAAPSIDEAKELLVGQLLAASTGALEIASLQIGLDLGLFAALRPLPATPPELAERAGIHPRYAREWLEQQYASGMVDVDDVAAAPDERRFTLPEAHAQVLLDPDDPAYFGPGVSITTSFVAAQPAVAAAFRSGDGVRFGDYGHLTRHGIGEINRAVFLNGLREWLTNAGIVDRLAAVDRPSVADVGCGTAWSTIQLARELPGASVVGVDLDPKSVEDARANVHNEGLSTRIAIRRGDAAKLDGGPYDLVTIFEMLHDSADPVGVLAAARQCLAPGGVVLLADEATAETFGEARGDLNERFQYGCSVLHCLPATMAEGPVEAIGTVIRPSAVRRYAAEAGFASCDEVEVTPGFLRVYALQ